MRLEQVLTAIVLLCMIALVGAATADATQDFRDEQTTNSYAYNVSDNGLQGIDNTTSYLDNIGTLIGVAAMIGVIMGLFAYFRFRG